jgi:uncharacterized protein
MPLFDLSPKESPATLFGREAELEQLARLVNAGRWAVVLGPRMVGKTSLIRAAAKRIDRTVVYVNLWGATGTSGFINAFVLGLNSNRSLLGRIRGRIRNLEGISVGPGGVSVTSPKQPLRTVWHLLNLIGQEAGKSVIELDEVQELSASSGPILKMLANIFNTFPHVGFVFTGSRFGLVKTLLDPGPTSPLFGRSPAELTLKPFNPKVSADFLEMGFSEYKLRPTRESLEAVVARSLGGTPGWLSLYGNHVAVGKLPLEKAERVTVEEGRKVARDELRHFLEGRSAVNYWPALRILATGVAWSELGNAVEARRKGPVNDKTVQKIVSSLLDAGFIEHVDNRYSIPDPMIRGYILANSKAP